MGLGDGIKFDWCFSQLMCWTQELSRLLYNTIRPGNKGKTSANNARLGLGKNKAGALNRVQQPSDILFG